MSLSNERLNISNEVNFIWKIANKLRGPYKPEKYKDVIIPMLIIRRFECVLENTKQQVLDIVPDFGHIEEVLNKKAGYKFHNKSEYDLIKLLNDPDNIANNFKSYLKGFSKDVKDILEKLDFEKQIDYLDTKNKLYSIVKEFSLLDLHPEVVPNIKMGYIFEDLIRKFSENAEAGDHYTPREVIRLAVNLLLNEDAENLSRDGNVVTILDATCGTGGMLSVATEYLQELNPDTEVVVFGQEINDESYAICKADMLIKGQDDSNIVLGNTLTQDAHQTLKVKYAIMNPPFGEGWEDDQEFVVREHKTKGFNGRFGAGLPSKSDGSLLFLQHMVSKLGDNGRGAIILNGSPLFSGGAESGESNIRKWLLEQDLIEAIVGLPNQMFYNTGIGTYIFIVTKNKPEHRKGKVQLVDASSFCIRMRKGLGDKKNEITPEHITQITELYDNFRENEFSKIFDNEDFLYRQITIERPLQLNFKISEERIENLYNESSFSNLFNEDTYNELIEKPIKTTAEQKKIETLDQGLALQNKIIEVLKQNISGTVYKNREVFSKHLQELLNDVPEVKGTLLKSIYMGLSERDETADVYENKKQELESDSSLRDIENVPFKKDINEYFEREVRPHVPNAWIDHSKTKIGAEIPFSRYFNTQEVLDTYENYILQAKSLEQEISKLLEEVLD